MKLSEILYSKTIGLWKEAAGKPFVTEMAKGTLADGKFRNYTLQDYLYLLDYVEILRRIKSLANEEDITDFLTHIIDETLQEAKRVHLPNMKKMGIRDEEIVKSNELPAISDYIKYMGKCPDEYGLLGGLTALLQCSWLYAFIGKTVKERYPAELEKSRYRSWFEAYSCQSYLDTNQMWIDFLDKQSMGIGEIETMKMCRIFEKCAVYENELWDALYE